MTSGSSVLICTVGGSHEPILTALRHHAPQFTCFVCSEADLVSGQSGSDRMIVGRGNVIAARRGDRTEHLPNIPTQAGLAEDAYEVLRVPPDDLEGAYQPIRRAIDGLAERYPGCRILADYTGGTKTMTAALVMAAVDDLRVEVQLVTGARQDLQAVRSGHEMVQVAPVELVRLEREMRPYLRAWGRFAYDEAAQGLASLAVPRHPELRARMLRARDLSRAFAAWDRFAHREALEILDGYARIVGRMAPQLLAAARRLAEGERGGDDDPIRLLDLYRNAERRATKGRFDDAVARLYRVVEWTVQWLLRAHAEIDTGAVRPEQLPEGFAEEAASRRGPGVLPLTEAWEVYAALFPDQPAGQFYRTQESTLRDLLQLRNHSILAHGKRPITEAEWRRFRTWTEDGLVPLVCDAARQAGKRVRLDQLPADPAPFLQV